MKKLKGFGASRGIAIAPPLFYLPQLPPISDETITDIDHEILRFDHAIKEVEIQIDSIQQNLGNQISKKDAEVFDAHRLMLHDPLFYDEIVKIIRDKSLNAPKAIQIVSDKICQTFESMEDDYFRQRASDIIDIRNQLIHTLLGTSQPRLSSLDRKSIVVAEELFPSDTAQLDASKVMGIVTARGGATSHAAIFARSLGIPAVVGVGDKLLDHQSISMLIIDGELGDVILNPTEETIIAYTARKEKEENSSKHAKLECKKPAITKDEKVVEIVANIGQIGEAEEALELGAEGVGLLRTEFLYLDRENAPTEDEQYEIYHQIAEVFGKHPVVIRTLDIGGDKRLPYISQLPEENPFLGVRGLRLCLLQPELLKCQLRAILRAAVGHNLKIMFPMVSTVNEIKQARQLLEEAKYELTDRQVAFGDVEIGIMIEIPSAALISDHLSLYVDFFSIGTNDLTQYTLAVDRTNHLVQNLADAFHPAVLRLIDRTIKSAHQSGRWVGLCGELAGEILAAPILLGLHLDEFSMSKASIPSIKQIIRSLSVKTCEGIAQQALLLDDSQSVREYVKSQIDGL
ncbi:MAG: phosphoenolpyruvate--protein phosphotransferase [Anaerolineae bacterium]|jgi:phosphoenolpyruvate-protein phosphotransferase|nr:MAG: phosphoenolpyruvate--protein phosphotransferase [Anaerolineae bacterium]